MRTEAEKYNQSWMLCMYESKDGENANSKAIVEISMETVD